jgi:hypothetical protein
VLRVMGLEVSHLPKTDAFGKCDCYLQVRCGKAEGRTKAVRNSYRCCKFLFEFNSRLNAIQLTRC